MKYLIMYIINMFALTYAKHYDPNFPFSVWIIVNMAGAIGMKVLDWDN